MMRTLRHTTGATLDRHVREIGGQPVLGMLVTHERVWVDNLKRWRSLNTLHMAHSREEKQGILANNYARPRIDPKPLSWLDAPLSWLAHRRSR